MSLTHHRRAIFTSALVFVSTCSLCLSQRNDASVTIPMQVISGLIYIQGEVNDSAPLSVILDTGASLSIVSPRVAETAGLKSTQTAEAAGIGKGSSQALPLLNDCEFKWGSQRSQARLLHQQGAILPIDYISSQTGKRADAIFGSNLFLHYTITTDYEHERVIFTIPGSGRQPLGTAIAMEVSSNTPFVEASIEGENGKKITGTFLVDSGASGAMLLNKKFLEAHAGLIAKTHFVDNPTVTAVGGAIRSQRVRLSHVKIGPFQFSDVIASVPETSSGVLSNPKIAGFIGSGILKRFTVTWDYTNKRVFLLPNNTLKAPFETDASGIHLTSPGPEYRTVMIDSVLPGSPAALAGLQQEDEILAVDGTSELPLWKVAAAFRKPETSVALKVQRKTTILNVKLSLHSPFRSTG